ncbi:hypothetical protein CONLIGDRAFT_243932 [Coniochaeta ligniaria NRRL 30616]|uniref:Uncharacterized protein n=1 Tax=Coniochaeta ligniaria NRRL 30616 TaxID=1408157 RepID=A0A1J7IX27_9PEZI|nr:hypothetical protein CONLIGDRAFT_243932 [Coniochaeta ligniaria NRRL 30616]
MSGRVCPRRRPRSRCGHFLASSPPCIFLTCEGAFTGSLGTVQFQMENTWTWLFRHPMVDMRGPTAESGVEVFLISGCPFSARVRACEELLTTTSFAPRPPPACFCLSSLSSRVSRLGTWAGRDYRERETTLEHGEHTETHPDHLFVKLAAETSVGRAPITAPGCAVESVSRPFP